MKKQINPELEKHLTHKMKRMRHDRGGKMPCLHCECDDTWGSSERAIDFLVMEHNNRV